MPPWGKNTALEQRQQNWELQQAIKALNEASCRLEMAGRNDLAREVREIRKRLG